MTDYQGQPYQEVIGKQGLVVVKYFAEWCGPCKMLNPVLQTVSEEKKDVSFVAIDIDKFRNQAVDAGVRSVPTVVIYKDGEEVDRQSGYQPKDKISAWIDKHK